MRIFVTGGTGFVGGHFCEALRARGHDVVALARSTSDTSVLDKAGCKIVQGSLSDPASLVPSLRGCDVVCHLAAITKAVGWNEFKRVNVGGTRAVALAARKAGFEGRFVLLSSLAAAGPSEGHRPRQENEPLAPVSMYGKSKLLSERVLAATISSETIVTLRPGGIYGPREHEIFEVVKSLAKTRTAIITGPDSRVQLTHVEDVVAALVLAVEHEDMRGKTFHVNDQDSYAMPRILDMLADSLGIRPRKVRVPEPLAWAAAGGIDVASRVAGKPLAPFNGDKMRELCAGSWIADSALLTRTTGWKPTWRLAEGLDDTVRWYRRHGWI